MAAVGDYLRRKLTAVQITNSITDRFHFETAIHHIIDLCRLANEMEDARKLFKVISTDAIRDAILKNHPILD